MVTERIKQRKDLRFISLSSDTTFKYLYKNQETREWFHRMIQGKFNLDLTGFTLVDNEFNTGNKIKDYRLDLNLQKEDTVVIIEMNDSYYRFLEAKNYQYLYRIAGKRFHEGEKYRNTQTKLILFNDFKNPHMKEIKTGNYIFVDPVTNLRIEDIESFEFYLPNFKEVCYDSSEIDISLSLFSCKSYEEMKKRTNNPLDLKIIEELEKLAMDEKFLFEYNHEIARKKTENSIRAESYEDGVEEGRKQGEKNKQIEIAKSMIRDKVEITTISKYTGLSIVEIENLSNAND